MVMSVLFSIVDILILTTEVSSNTIVSIPGNQGIKDTLSIFLHNFLIFITVIILGNLTFGFSTVILLAYTFFFTAFRIAEFYSLSGNKEMAIFTVLIHGIPEVMAISTSADISFETFRRWIFPKKKNAFRSKDFLYTTMFKTVIGIFLLLLASILEVFVTTKILQLLH